MLLLTRLNKYFFLITAISITLQLDEPYYHVMKNLSGIIGIMIILCFLSCEDRKAEYILAIVDSHGAIEQGWVDQLRELRPNDSILNYCISGNTIGFDNLNRDTLNTIKNINKYINKAVTSSTFIIPYRTNSHQLLLMLFI